MITSFGHSAWSRAYSTKTGTSAPCKQPKTGHFNLKPSPMLYHEDHQMELLVIKHAERVRDVGNSLKRRAEEEEGCWMDLRLVDAIQRLGIDDHFKEEIAKLLQKHYCLSEKGILHSIGDGPPYLHEASLSFRLRRQEGHFVTPDVLEKFLDKKGRFCNLKTETYDFNAWLELYEAAQLGIGGEDILDAVADFSSHLLIERTRSRDDDDARTVRHTLKHPCRKSLARSETMNSITAQFDGEDMNGLGKALQELSFAENNIARSMHRQELLQISKWWEKLGIVRDLEHARDQPMKWYAWSTACLKDLSLSDERVDLTKTVSFIYLIDDIFDLYGKPRDLDLFTQAVKRWELAAIDKLPEYMKKCFMALYVFTNEAAMNIQRKHGINPIESLRTAWGDLCSAFLTESRWFLSGSKNLPKAGEYLENAKISSGLPVVAVHMFFLFGFGTEKRSPVTLDDASGMISSVATILRLWDDLGSSKDEGQDGYDGSFINYYLNDHEGFPIELATEKVSNMISDEWKKLNKECLRLNQSSSSFQKGILNLARMVPLMYSYNDEQHLPDLQDYIKVML